MMIKSRGLIIWLIDFLSMKPEWITFVNDDAEISIRTKRII